MKIIIFQGPKVTKIVSTTLNLYEESRLEIQPILVTPRQNFLSKSNQNCQKVLYDDELEDFNLVKSWLEKKIIQKKLCTKKPACWYLQQFLKLSCAWNLKEWVFIQDGDTIFAPHLIKKVIENIPTVLVSNENVKKYSNGCKILKIPIMSNKSFITNGGLFNGILLNKLGKSPAEWFISSLEKILVPKQYSDFSEYQVMGNMISWSFPETKQKRIKFFRRFDLLKKEKSKLISNESYKTVFEKYDVISFENTHCQDFWRNLLASIAYKLKISW